MALSNAGYSPSTTTARAIARGSTDAIQIRDLLISRPDVTGHLSNNKEFAIVYCSGVVDTWVSIVTSRLQTECGNALLETGEGCDDKNTAPGDGCSAACSVEPGWGCANPNLYDGLGSYCTPNPNPPCQPKPVCAGRVCGTVWNGCANETCGSCPVGELCDDSQGRCACQPTGTCQTNNQDCGTFWDGCRLLNCSQDGTAGCPAGFNCTQRAAIWTCVANPQPCITQTCADRGITCGSIRDNCDPTNPLGVVCGACIVGETCVKGQCQAACNGQCDARATCTNNACTCNTGYTGDGYTCTKISVPVKKFTPGLGSLWTAIGDGFESPSTTGPHTVFWDDSSQLITDAIAKSRVTLQASVTLGASGEAGFFLGETGTSSFTTVSITTSRLYVLEWASGVLESGYYWEVATPAATPTRLSLTLSASNQIRIDVGSASYGPYTWSGPLIGAAGLYANGYESGSIHFIESLLFSTSTTVTITLAECMTPTEVKAYVAAQLRIPVSQVDNINIIQSCTRKRQGGVSMSYSFDIASDSGSSAALGSDFVSQIESGKTTAGLGAVRSAEVVTDDSEVDDLTIAASVLGAVAAVGLTAGIIAAIAVGGVCGTAVVAGGVTYGVGRYRESHAEEVEMEAPARRSTILVTMKTAFTGPKGGVNLMRPVRDQSITGRSNPE